MNNDYGLWGTIRDVLLLLLLWFLFFWGLFLTISWLYRTAPAHNARNIPAQGCTTDAECCAMAPELDPDLCGGK